MSNTTDSALWTGDAASLRAAAVACLTVSCSLGTASNALVLALLCRAKSLRTFPNIYLLGLVTNDLVTCALISPLRLVVLGVRSPGALCSFEMTLSNLCLLMQLCFITLIALERYFAIADPFQAIHDKKARGKNIFLASLLLSCVVCVTVPIFLDSSVMRVCKWNTVYKDFIDYSAFIVILPAFFITVLFVVVCYSYITVKLMKSIKQKQERACRSIVVSEADKPSSMGEKNTFNNSKARKISTEEITPAVGSVGGNVPGLVQVYNANGTMQLRRRDSINATGAVCTINPETKRIGKTIRESRIAKRALATILLFFCMWAPFPVLLGLALARRRVAGDRAAVLNSLGLDYLGYCLLCLASALHPLLNCLLHKQLKLQLRARLHTLQACCRKAWRERRPRVSSTWYGDSGVQPHPPNAL